MCIDLILLLASRADLTGKACLAVDAESQHSTTKYNPKFESVDGNRSSSSERSLRVRASMDEEDEERFAIDLAKISSKVAQLATQPTVEEKVARIVRLVSEGGATNSVETWWKIKRLVKNGVCNRTDPVTGLHCILRGSAQYNNGRISW
ncbi:hypothetical protein PsorP6_013135 [Peronosclerospora sorghi]|uniref:Uncharacterized protein n=1 Tax=Peronosclerospora sorghi TaxID=230839 RepID=A0ACC0WFP3_9STRA|nr:hypothetical protein PsorP6_013135 [Peronosclerospora sorghi]